MGFFFDCDGAASVHALGRADARTCWAVVAYVGGGGVRIESKHFNMIDRIVGATPPLAHHLPTTTAL